MVLALELHADPLWRSCRPLSTSAAIFLSLLYTCVPPLPAQTSTRHEQTKRERSRSSERRPGVTRTPSRASPIPRHRGSFLTRPVSRSSRCSISVFPSAAHLYCHVMAVELTLYAVGISDWRTSSPLPTAYVVLSRCSCPPNTLSQTTRTICGLHSSSRSRVSSSTSSMARSPGGGMSPA